MLKELKAAQSEISQAHHELSARHIDFPEAVRAVNKAKFNLGKAVQEDARSGSHNSHGLHSVLQAIEKAQAKIHHAKHQSDGTACAVLVESAQQAIREELHKLESRHSQHGRQH